MSILVIVLAILTNIAVLQADDNTCRPYEEMSEAIRTLIDTQAFDDALYLLNCALELDPDNIDALDLRAKTYLFMGQVNQSMVASVAVVERTTIESPFYIPNQLNIIDMLIIREDYRRASERAFRLIELEDGELSEMELSSIYVLLGTISVLTDMPEDAIDYFTQALTYDPEQSIARYWRGVAYERVGNERQAEQDKARAVVDAPNVGRIIAGYGTIYLGLEKYDIASFYYTLAIEAATDEDDEVWTYYASRGAAYFFDEQYQNVIPDMTYVLENAEGNELALLLRGCSYLEIGNNDAAIDDLSEVIRLFPHPGFADAYECRGNAYYAAGEFEEALADYQSYVALIDTDIVTVDPVILERIEELDD